MNFGDRNLGEMQRMRSLRRCPERAFNRPVFTTRPIEVVNRQHATIGTHQCAWIAEIAIEAIIVDQLFSAGPRGAFHLTCTGTYRGGFDDIDPAQIGQPVTLALAGIFDSEGDQIVHVQVTADRLGLNRALMPPR